MSLYQLRPPEPSQRRSPWLITTVLVLLMFLLGAALWVFTRGDLGLALLTTPTPSPTPGTPATATPDFRATIIAEDQATQAAYLAVVTRQTPVVQFVPVAMGGIEETATAVSLNLPVVGGGAAFSPLETPTPDQSLINLPGVQVPPPEPLVNPESPLETPTPEGPPAPIVIETETPTPTETPVETETPTMTPVPTVFLVDELRAFIAPTLTATTVWLHDAPSNRHFATATLVPGTEVRLRGRDETGEWVFVCCPGNDLNWPPRWIRQAYAPPSHNQLQPNAPAGATPNDVRWLPVRPWPGNIQQDPPATPIPSQDYPFFRRDRANTGRVPVEQPGYLNLAWSDELTTNNITTPVLVHGSYVLVAGADRHIYGIDRIGGNQLWKYNADTVINLPPAIQDDIYYYIDEQNRATAIIVGNQVALWQKPLWVPDESATAIAETGIVIAGERLFVGVRHDDKHFILQLARSSGEVLRAFEIGSVASQPLVVGHQLLYVAANGLWALDIENFEQVWVQPGFTLIRTPPLYAADGVSALAELYVAFVNGTIVALDANTGVEIRRYDAQGDTTTGLALGDTALYATGDGFIKAWDRGSNDRLWREPTAGEVRGGAIVTPNYLIVVTASGAIQFFDPFTGGSHPGATIGAQVPEAPAVSGSYLYVPGSDRRVYGFIQ
jgi:outer membrane protein assembly factor BamB